MTTISYLVCFTIGKTDWTASIEYSDKGQDDEAGNTIIDPEWEVLSVEMDSPHGSVPIEDSDLDLLGAMMTDKSGTCSFRTFRQIADAAVEEDLADISQAFREYTEEL